MAQNCGDESHDNVANIPDLPQQYESKVSSVKVPRFKQPGGYDCDFVEKPPSVIQTECSICLQILREPQLISCCGHNFCGVCIGRIKNDGKFCPLCNAEDFNLMRNKGLERSLNEFDVNCSYFEQGCCWVGKLGQLSKHLEEDDSSTVCSFVEVKCSHDCGDYYERRSIKQHEEFECPKRPFSCDYCRDFSSTFEDVVYNHYPGCGSYPLPCPNKCDHPYAIERKDLANHVDNDCPLAVVDCDFHYAGCAVRLPRKDMPDHLRENITHLSLMAAKLMEKDKQIATVTSEITQRQDDLEKQVCTLREENILLKQENAKTNQALKCEISTLRKVNTLQSTMQSRSERTIQSMTDRLQRNVMTFRTELSASMENHKKGLDEKVEQNVKTFRAELSASMKEQKKGLDEKVEQNVERNVKTFRAELTASMKEHKKGLDEKVEQNVKTFRAELSASMKEQKKGLDEKVERYVKTFRADLSASMKEQKKGLGEKVEQNCKNIASLCSHTGLPPCVLIMTNFSKKKDELWFSQPFYTHPRGYKMCLKVDANGSGSGEGTHVSVFVYRMQGEFDDQLQWPFRGSVTIQLLNQRGGEGHHELTLHFNDKTPVEAACRVTVGERADAGWGTPKFIDYDMLQPDYLQNDQLRFCISKGTCTS